MAEQKEGQDHVRLLDDAVPVNDQRMIVQQQRKMSGRLVFQVPELPVRKLSSCR
jgi:hypothetical protein